MQGNPDAPGQVKKRLKNREPIPAVPDTPGNSVSIRRDGGFVYAVAAGFDPGAMNADFQSQPLEPGPRGCGVSLYTTDDDGSVAFPVQESYILPDFPRTLTVTVWDDADPPGKASATETYQS
jgi:hypothetical protein